jgi:hypothetical protein
MGMVAKEVEEAQGEIFPAFVACGRLPRSVTSNLRKSFVDTGNFPLNCAVTSAGTHHGGPSDSIERIAQS